MKNLSAYGGHGTHYLCDQPAGAFSMSVVTNDFVDAINANGVLAPRADIVLAGGTHTNLSLTMRITWAAVPAATPTDTTLNGWTNATGWVKNAPGNYWEATFTKASSPFGSDSIVLATVAGAGADGGATITYSGTAFSDQVSSFSIGTNTTTVYAIVQDATDGKYYPSSAAQWTDFKALFALSFTNPADLYLFQEASGNPADSIGSKTLTASGTLIYQHTVTGHTRKGIKTTAGSAGRMLNTAFTSVGTESKLVILIAYFPTPVSATRTLYRFGTSFNGDASVELTSGGSYLAQVGDGSTRTSGGSDPTAAARPFVLGINRSANSVKLYTDQEKVIDSGTGSVSATGTELCFGGDNNATWFPFDTDYMYAAVFTSTAAEISDATIKTILQSLGWTIPWS